jgi:hypothetical protein
MLYKNIVRDSLFNQSQNIFNQSLETTLWSDANKGWFNSSNSKWKKDNINKYAYARNETNGSGGLTQIIKNNGLNKGLQSISFDAINKGTNNTLRLQIYGIYGKFKLSNGNTQNPISATTAPIEFKKLLDTQNLADQEFNWKTFNQDVNFEGGYEYIAVRFLTDEVTNTELIAVDNISIANKMVENNSSISIGTNLNGIAYWSPQKPFIDLFKSSDAWITQAKGIWNTKESDLLDLDENGWVRSLPKLEDGTQFTSVATLLSRLSDGNYTGGKYVVLYEGEGKINYGFDAELISSTPGRDVIQVNPSKAGILVSITETDPHQTGNYLRDINVVPRTSENTYETDIFNPDFLNHIDSFNTLRFMDWMATNNSEEKEWQDRLTLDSQTWARSKGGAPVEIMVELANKQDINPWFTIPHQATDEYITNFATYVKEHLDPELKIYIEYSNEVWNWQFKQAKWIDQQAKAAGLDSWMDGYSKRTTEITQIWDNVFGNDQERVIGVMGAQAGNTGIGNRALSYRWTDSPLSHEEYGIDAVAIAPYFGGHIGDKTNKDILLSWTQEPDGGLNNLFDEITKGGLLPNSPNGGALGVAYNRMAKYIEIANKENLPLIAYEGGQHLVDKSADPAIVDLFAKANRDPRMGEIYEEYFQTWFNMGGGEFVNFTDVGSYSKFGSWGLTESLNQSSPKYDAVINVIESKLQ